MIRGNVNKIDMGTQSFEEIITHDNLYVDKTRLIEHVLTNANKVILITRHRRLGKSLNMDMLRCFLTMERDHRDLFRGLYIEQSHVWQEAHSHPVLYFDFKNFTAKNYQEKIYTQVMEQLLRYVQIEQLDSFSQSQIQKYTDGEGSDEEGIFMLSKYVYRVTQKPAYILIDEYYHLLTDEYLSPQYDEIRSFMTGVLSAALKGNAYLARGVLTGVMRISHEGMLSGLNNIQTYDVFEDDHFAEDYGLTDAEVVELDRYLVQSERPALEQEQLKKWYNGITVNGTRIYNIFSTMSLIQKQQYRNYWGRSGAIEMISRQLDDDRLNAIAALLQGDSITTDVNVQVSLQELAGDSDDASFYSLLVQAGYLAIAERITRSDENIEYMLVIPNREIRKAWQEYIIRQYGSRQKGFRDMFRNIRDPKLLASDLTELISNKLSYYDLSIRQDERDVITPERIYHIFVLGMVSHYDHVKSNRESGAGRYDILIELERNSIIFEFKQVDDRKKLLATAQKALDQVKDRNYAADIAKSANVTIVGIALCGKECAVLCERLER
jgi:hypothetical protein